MISGQSMDGAMCNMQSYSIHILYAIMKTINNLTYPFFGCQRVRVNGMNKARLRRCNKLIFDEINGRDIVVRKIGWNLQEKNDCFDNSLIGIGWDSLSLRTF